MIEEFLTTEKCQQMTGIDEPNGDKAMKDNVVRMLNDGDNDDEAFISPRTNSGVDRG